MTGKYIIHNIDVCHQVNHRLQVPTLAIMFDTLYWLPCGVVGRADVRSRNYQNFYGAQLASASRARGAPLSCNFCHFLKSAPTLLDDEFEDSFVHLYSVPCTD